MADIKLKWYNARRAEVFGKELTLVNPMVLTKSDPHTHVEFQFSDRYHSDSFSATIEDGIDGCRFLHIDYSHPERWDTLIVPLSDEEENEAFYRAEELNGHKYDLIGAITFSPDKDTQKGDPNKFWCSETCAELLKAAGKSLIYRPDRYMPTGLFFEVFYWLQQNQGVK